MTFPRNYKIPAKKPNVDSRPLVVDLFAGAGGFSLGAMLAGMKVVAALENNKQAAHTYRRNLIDSKLTETKLCEEDILDLAPREFMEKAGLQVAQCDLLLGGPPCQGFSAHRIKDAGVGDPRNRLLLRYFEYVRLLRPTYFLVENVPGLLWPRHSHFVDKFYPIGSAEGNDALCMSPACDMVDREPGKTQLWMSALHPMRPMVAVALTPIVEPAKALKNAEEVRTIFLKVGESIKAFDVLSSNGGPSYEFLFLEDGSKIVRDGTSAKFQATRLKGRTEQSLHPELVSVTLEVIAQVFDRAHLRRTASVS